MLPWGSLMTSDRLVLSPRRAWLFRLMFLSVLPLISLGLGQEAPPTVPVETANHEAAHETPPPAVVPDPSKTNPMDSLDDKKIIAVGNLLEFRVIEDLDEEPDPKSKNEASKSDQRPQNLLQVSDSGEVEHPYFGRVLAKGKTHKQLAMEIKQILEKDLYYQATVLISLRSVWVPMRKPRKGTRKPSFIALRNG